MRESLKNTLSNDILLSAVSQPTDMSKMAF